MVTFFIYLIQVNIALTIFFLLYALVLKKDTFFALRRFFFLSVIIFSLLYPFFAIPSFNEILNSRSTVLQESNATVYIGEPSMAMVMETDTTAPASISWEEVLSLFYFVVTLLFLIRFASQLFSIYRIWRKSIKKTLSGIPVYQISANITPFSFFKFIFIHPNKHTGKELDQILMHEQTHVRQWHSIDIMLIEGIFLFSWWNPLVWLMKREIAINLEYLADKGVLLEGVDCKDYQYHLLRLTYHETAVQIVNNFNVSQLKQRIMMMNKVKSPTMTIAKYFLTVPLFFIFLTANTVFAAQNEDKSLVIGVLHKNIQEAEKPIQPSVNLPESPPKKVTDEIFVVVEKQPEYQGGKDAMFKFLADKIKYPVIAQENGIQGRVVCDFVVKKDGTIGNISVLHSVDPSLDAEVIRVIKAMPKWKPGTQKGSPVDVKVILPAVFRLQGVGSQKDVHKNIDISSFPEGIQILDELVIVGYGVQKPVDQDKKKTLDNDEVFVVVDNPPVFPGGNEAMMNFLAENTKYPVIAQENGIQGLVSAVYNINSKGKVTFVRFENAVDPSLDKEVKRVIESMPDWTPAKISGEVTSTTTGANFVFRLQGDGIESYSGKVPDDPIVVVGYGSQKK